jgi:hypothetical protein
MVCAARGLAGGASGGLAADSVCAAAADLTECEEEDMVPSWNSAESSARPRHSERSGSQGEPLVRLDGFAKPAERAKLYSEDPSDNYTEDPSALQLGDGDD